MSPVKKTVMANFNKLSQNSNKNGSRFAILRTRGFVDDSDENEVTPDMRITDRGDLDITIDITEDHSISFLDENEFDDFERSNTNYVAEFAKTPTAFFNDFDHHTPLIFDSIHDVLPDLISIRDEQENLCGGLEADEDADDNVEVVVPLHVYLNIPGFRADDRSGTLGTISWVLAKLEKSGIHPFPGRTNINLPTIAQLVSEGYDHKVSETFRPDLALMNSKAIGTMCKWIYDEHIKAMENLTVKVNVQTIDNAVEFIFQKKTDKPQATVHGGSTQAGVDEVVALVVAKHLAENPNAFGGGGATKASVPRDIIRESNTPKIFKAAKIGGSARPAPPRCDSWPSAETILADLATAVPHIEGMVASATYTLTEGTPEGFATWCMSAIGKKSIEITAKKDGSRRVRIFAGDKLGHVKGPIGGGASKR